MFTQMSVAPRSRRSCREYLGATPHPDTTLTGTGAPWQGSSAGWGAWLPQNREQGDETCRQMSAAIPGLVPGTLGGTIHLFLLPWRCLRQQPAGAADPTESLGAAVAVGSLDGGGLQENSVSWLQLSRCLQGAGAPAPVCVPTQGSEASGLGGAPVPHTRSHPAGGKSPSPNIWRRNKLLCVGNYFNLTPEESKMVVAII